MLTIYSVKLSNKKIFLKYLNIFVNSKKKKSLPLTLIHILAGINSRSHIYRNIKGILSNLKPCLNCHYWYQVESPDLSVSVCFFCVCVLTDAVLSQYLSRWKLQPVPTVTNTVVLWRYHDSMVTSSKLHFPDTAFPQASSSDSKNQRVLDTQVWFVRSKYRLAEPEHIFPLHILNHFVRGLKLLQNVRSQQIRAGFWRW